MRVIRTAPRPGLVDLAYLLPDPWDLDHVRERARHEWTARLISEHFGPVQTLLEIGCGEGAQTRHLLSVCTDLTGIDLSRRAIARARQRVPEARFVVGDPLHHDPTPSLAPFDLVLACEVLYYCPDPESALQALGRLSRNYLVTVHERSASTVLPSLYERAGQNRSSLNVEGVTWLAAWWGSECHVE